MLHPLQDRVGHSARNMCGISPDMGLRDENDPDLTRAPKPSVRFHGKSNVDRLMRTALRRKRGASKVVNVLDDLPQVAWQSVPLTNEGASPKVLHRSNGTPGPVKAVCTRNHES